jgi:hypothetical protein
MHLRISLALVLLIMAGIPLACSGSALRKHMMSHATAAIQENDLISGEWDVSFKVQGQVTPATFTLKLEGDKVTGSAYSEHTGEGTIRDGSWKDQKLSFTLDFKKHESIVIIGSLKDGKLAGVFRTEGFEAPWEAVRKARTGN